MQTESEPEFAQQTKTQMKTHSDVPKTRPTEVEIREKAHELYVRSGWLAGRDLDNWLEAEAFLVNELAIEITEHPSTRDHLRSHHPNVMRKSA
jgi:hypothetical protein